MDDLVDNLIKEIQSTNSPYVLKSTKITTGPRMGSVFIEVISKTGFRFLSLHSEIRDQIYKLVLVKPDPICLAMFRRNNVAKVVTGTGFDNSKLHPGKVWDQRNHKWTGDPLNELSLLRVNKQIHMESTPIVYGNNSFVQGSSTALVYFAAKIGSSIKFLTVVDFGESCVRDNMKRLFTVLVSATGLRKLKLSETMALRAYGFNNNRPRDNFADCGAILAKDLRSLLLCLQVAYTGQGRTWKARDVVQIRPAFTKMHMPLQRWKDARDFETMVRALTNVYLKDE